MTSADAAFDQSTTNRPQKMIAKAYGTNGGLSRQFRAKRFAHLLPMIDDIIARKGHCRIADIGGTKYYWDIAGDFAKTRPLEIHLINREPVEADGTTFIDARANATDLSVFDDMSFDLVHSNSVIEHVGDWTSMMAMAREVRRLAPSYYVQTPNFWFPYEPHFRCAFFHWLPEQIRYRLVMQFALGFAERKATIDDAMTRIQSARLIDRRQLSELFPDATLRAERFLGVAKSYTAIREG